MNCNPELQTAKPHYPSLATKMAAMSHPARLEILTHLAAQTDCCCCKDVVGQLDLAQSTVSQHLKILVEAGLVRLTPKGQKSLYEIDRSAFSMLAGSLNQLLTTCCKPA